MVNSHRNCQKNLRCKKSVNFEDVIEVWLVNKPFVNYFTCPGILLQPLLEINSPLYTLELGLGTDESPNPPNVAFHPYRVGFG